MGILRKVLLLKLMNIAVLNIIKSTVYKKMLAETE
jgi:hypothetical protein